VNVGSPGLGNPELIFLCGIEVLGAIVVFVKNVQTAASALWNGTRSLPTLHCLEVCGYYLVHFSMFTNCYQLA
jgi:hypothetical protein